MTGWNISLFRSPLGIDKVIYQGQYHKEIAGLDTGDFTKVKDTGVIR